MDAPLPLLVAPPLLRSCPSTSPVKSPRTFLPRHFSSRDILPRTPLFVLSTRPWILILFMIEGLPFLNGLSSHSTTSTSFSSTINLFGDPPALLRRNRPFSISNPPLPSFSFYSNTSSATTYFYTASGPTYTSVIATSPISLYYLYSPRLSSSYPYRFIYSSPPYSSISRIYSIPFLTISLMNSSSSSSLTP